MMLMMATKARMKVMYVFVRLNVSFTENVLTASPPPKMATSRNPYDHEEQALAISAIQREAGLRKEELTFESTHARRTFVRTLA